MLAAPSNSRAASSLPPAPAAGAAHTSGASGDAEAGSFDAFLGHAAAKPTAGGRSSGASSTAAERPARRPAGDAPAQDERAAAEVLTETDVAPAAVAVPVVEAAEPVAPEAFVLETAEGETAPAEGEAADGQPSETAGEGEGAVEPRISALHARAWSREPAARQEGRPPVDPEEMAPTDSAADEPSSEGGEPTQPVVSRGAKAPAEAAASSDASARVAVPAPTAAPAPERGRTGARERRGEILAPDRPEMAAAKAALDAPGAGQEGATRPITGGAEVAARFAGESADPARAATTPGGEQLEKAAEAVVNQVVKPAAQALGIDPANVRPVMEFLAADSVLAATTPTSETSDPAVAAGAARTIERVVQTAELMQANGRSGLNLRLDFGDSGPLNVQITLRQGRVHTFFRSDSPEVRETLSNAWSSFVQRGEGASLPLADAVVLPLRAAAPASSPAGDSSRFADSFGQPDADSRSSRQHRDDAPASPSWFRLNRSRGAAPTVTPSVSTGRSPTSGHLSVHA